MIDYALVGRRLEVTFVGESSLELSAAAFAGIRCDPRVPAGLPLLIDARAHAPTAVTSEAIEARVTQIFELLGPKASAHCSVVIADNRLHQLGASLVEAHARAKYGAQVRAFRDLEAARRWLETVRTDGIPDAGFL